MPCASGLAKLPDRFFVFFGKHSLRDSVRKVRDGPARPSRQFSSRSTGALKMSFRRSLVPSPFSHLALTIALFSVVTANSQSSAGQPSRSCHKTMSCSTKSGPIRLQAPHAAPSHELKASAHQPSSQVTTGKAADSNVPTTSNPQLQERLGELSQRMQQHVEACRKAAQQAANDEQAAKTESSAIGQSIDKSRRLILLGRKLLSAS